MISILEKLKIMISEAKKSGRSTPNFDLCSLYVTGTNPFCEFNLGVERKDMPQLKGIPIPGTQSSLLPSGKDGKVSIEKPLIDELQSRGVEVKPKKVDASYLKPTQGELDGYKVIGMIQALEKNATDPKITAPIFVSRDGYILDGHHRWAAIVGHNFTADKPILMNVIEVDSGIEELVRFANNFAESMGIKKTAARLFLIAERCRRVPFYN
jgi:hypothetical protein